MKIQDITVEVRSSSLGRLGVIDPRYLTDLKIIKRFCNVGSWTMSLPAKYKMAQLLAQPGRGIIVTASYKHRVTGVYSQRTLISGDVISFNKIASVSDPVGVFKFVGADDNVHLSDALAWPQPSNPDVATQNKSHDVRTASAETLLLNYVNDNIGPSAPVSRRIDGLTIPGSLNRGATVTGRARFDKLGQLMYDIALAGGVGFDMRSNGTNIELEVYEPSDKSQQIRMDIMNNQLKETEVGLSAPGATRAIVAGQGEGIDRTFVQVTSAEATTAEGLWRRKIELFKDRRDTPDPVELTQEGDKIIAENGKTITSLSVKPSDTSSMVYGLDWYLGDIVGVVVDGQELSALVTEAIIVVNSRGVRIGATIGDPVGFDYEAKLQHNQQQQDRRIAFLEKNSEVLRSRGTTAERDEVFGVPTTDAQRVALANQRLTWFNTDLGWEESYYATAGLPGLTAKGLAASIPSGWFPTGEGPLLVLEPTTSFNATAGNAVGNWHNGNRRQVGGSDFWFYNTLGFQTAKLPGIYDVTVWTLLTSGSGTANFHLRKLNVGTNAVEDQVDGLAFTLTSTLAVRMHAEYYDAPVGPGGKIFVLYCHSGTLAVHTLTYSPRAQFMIRYKRPYLVNDG